MKLLRSLAAAVLLMVCALLFVACGARQMEPAKQAVDAAESGVSAAAGDAAKYMPDQLAALQARVTQLKVALDQGEYAAVLSKAPVLTGDAKALAEAAAATKEESVKALSAQWTSLVADVPDRIGPVKTRIAVLSQHKPAPKGMDLAAAQAALAEADKSWGKAQDLDLKDDLEGAVKTGKYAEAQVDAAILALQSKAPAVAAK